MVNFSLLGNAYGFIIACGVALGIFLGYVAAKYRGWDTDVVFDMAILGVPLAIIGARLYYVIFDTSGTAWTFKRVIGCENGRFQLEGLAIYGGVLMLLVALFILAQIYKRKGKGPTFMQMCDLGAAFLLLGQAIGRWGNFANNEVYGNVCKNQNLPFPFAVAVGASGTKHYALFFYESMWNLAGAILIAWLIFGKRRSFPGLGFSLYMIWYGTGRAVLEGMRDSQYILTIGEKMPVSKLLSFILIGIGLAYFVYQIYKARVEGRRIPLLVRYEDWPETGYPMSYYGNPPGTKFKLFERKPKKSLFDGEKEGAGDHAEEELPDDNEIADKKEE